MSEDIYALIFDLDGTTIDSLDEANIVYPIVVSEQRIADLPALERIYSTEGTQAHITERMAKFRPLVKDLEDFILLAIHVLKEKEDLAFTETIKEQITEYEGQYNMEEVRTAAIALRKDIVKEGKLPDLVRPYRFIQLYNEVAETNNILAINTNKPLPTVRTYLKELKIPAPNILLGPKQGSKANRIRNVLTTFNIPQNRAYFSEDNLPLLQEVHEDGLQHVHKFLVNWGPLRPGDADYARHENSEGIILLENQSITLNELIQRPYN